MPWVAAATAIGGFLSSEEGRRASKSERQRMQRLLDAMQDPNFDVSQIDFPDYQVLERYVPKVSDYVQEVDPKFIEMSAEAKEGRGAQLEALRRLQQAGSEEGDILSDTAINEANRKAAISNQGMQGQILENMRRRGVGGSGLELAAQLSAQQAAGERGALSSEAAGAEGYRNRLNALMQSGELGGRIKNEELDLEGKNTSILNAFNQRNATNRNAYNQYADELANKAQLYNVGEKQRVYEKNTGGDYDAKVANRNRLNELAQQKFQNDMSRVTGQQAQSAINQQANSNDTKDRNNAIQGVGNTASAYYQREDDNEQREKDRKAGMYTDNSRRQSDKY